MGVSVHAGQAQEATLDQWPWIMPLRNSYQLFLTTLLTRPSVRGMLICTIRKVHLNHLVYIGAWRLGRLAMLFAPRDTPLEAGGILATTLLVFYGLIYNHVSAQANHRNSRRSEEHTSELQSQF